MKKIFFFVGTEAELIKVFPTIMLCKKKFPTYIIASGQNDLRNSRIMEELKDVGLSVELSDESKIKKNAVGLIWWYIETYSKALKKIKSVFGKQELSDSYMMVHGDTVSTYMGACLGQKLGMTVCHIEAGLRSHNLLNPFPEEIDRMLTSKKARIHFAPGDEPYDNLKKVKGVVINTKYNTIIDSLDYSIKMTLVTKEIQQLTQKPYFVFVMHRQENLANNYFVKGVIKRIEALAENVNCVIILHAITKVKFIELGVLDRLNNNSRIKLLPRVDYFDFMKLLDGAEFVITDGGSNQEELHYMGKPCLIMRKTTERKEGLGQNALLYEGDLRKIEEFGTNYKKYKIDKTYGSVSPSRIIVDYLESL